MLIRDASIEREKLNIDALKGGSSFGKDNDLWSDSEGTNLSSRPFVSGRNRAGKSRHQSSKKDSRIDNLRIVIMDEEYQ